MLWNQTENYKKNGDRYPKKSEGYRTKQSKHFFSKFFQSFKASPNICKFQQHTCTADKGVLFIVPVQTNKQM